jgi:polycomb protein SUZ12
MIDEFTDVNEGEKELMKLWNLHVMKHGFVGDCQISYACELFLKEKGLELLEKNLYRNYIVHLDSMFNYGLISPQTIMSNVRTLNVRYFLKKIL